ncbi:MAG: hypothetical protein R3240_01960 [Gammaproteobacteria bacterium]|nr:hypothetical protein [Gammaproteobacteria bacterium]
MNYFRYILAGFLLVANLKLTFAQELPAHQINLPLFDSPENSSFSLKNPGMYQSLQVSKSFYQFSHYSIQKIWKQKSTKTLVGIIVFDTVSGWLPLANSWLHEEWHRAVLNDHGISSHNGIYDLQFFTETISVDHVDENRLAAFKQQHPQAFIRMHTAGLEAQTQLNLALETDKFYFNTKSFDYMLLWFNKINTSAYLNACSTSEADRISDDILNHEGVDQDKRDFTGMDCNAWVYDLFRSNEGYADRGTHPSGVGIKRYITYSDLTTEEKSFLRKQYYLSFLNFIDPFLLSMDYFQLPESVSPASVKWNTRFEHYLNPFGYSINWDIFVDSNRFDVLLQLKNYFNQTSYFPGVTASLFNFPLLSASKLNVEASIWQQPSKLSFTTHNAQTGGHLQFSTQHTLSKYLAVYMDLAYKTSGWLEGFIDLNAGFYVRAGLLINRY